MSFSINYINLSMSYLNGNLILFIGLILGWSVLNFDLLSLFFLNYHISLWKWSKSLNFFTLDYII